MTRVPPNLQSNRLTPAILLPDPGAGASSIAEGGRRRGGTSRADHEERQRWVQGHTTCEPKTSKVSHGTRGDNGRNSHSRQGRHREQALEHGSERAAALKLAERYCVQRHHHHSQHGCVSRSLHLETMFILHDAACEMMIQCGVSTRSINLSNDAQTSTFTYTLMYVHSTDTNSNSNTYIHIYTLCVYIYRYTRPFGAAIAKKWSTFLLANSSLKCVFLVQTDPCFSSLATRQACRGFPSQCINS